MPVPKTEVKPSNKHFVVDHRFAAILSEDFGIPAATILDALQNEPQKAAIAICAWAERTEDPAFALTSWARKHNKGRCRRTARPAGTLGRRHGESQENTGDDHRDAARPSDTSRRWGGSYGLDSARIRANVSRIAD